jgi:hypothetical protein
MTLAVGPLLFFAVSILVILVVVLVALKTRTGSQLALRALSSYMEQSVGMRVKADYLRLGVFGGWWEADGLRLAYVDPEDPPILELRHVRAFWEKSVASHTQISSLLPMGPTSLRATFSWQT